MNTLVVLESNRGDLHRLSKEAIVAAQGLGGEVSAIILGKDAEIIASELINVKLEEIIMVKNEYVNSYNADGYTEIISNVIKQESPKKYSFRPHLSNQRFCTEIVSETKYSIYTRFNI